MSCHFAPLNSTVMVILTSLITVSVAGRGGARKMLQFAPELGEDEHLKRISSMLVQELVR